jgi:hypothetical protein
MTADAKAISEHNLTSDKGWPKCEDSGRSVRHGTNSKLGEFNDEP